MGNVSSYEIDESNFDYEQYKKDITELNMLTSRILKNNPSCVKGYKRDSWDGSLTEVDYANKTKTVTPAYPTSKTIPNYEKLGRSPMMSGDQVLEEMDQIARDGAVRSDVWEQFDGNKFVFDKDYHEKQAKKMKEEILKKSVKVVPSKEKLNFFGSEYVGEKLSNDIIEKSRERIADDRPPIAKDLHSLGLYGVYTISQDKFDAAYLDFVMSEDNSVKAGDPINKFPDSLNEPSIPSIEARIFNQVCRMTPKYIPLENKSIEVGIKDFINDEFVKVVKELADKNVDEKITNHMKFPLIIENDSKDSYSKICNRIAMISSFIQVRNRRGPATFIYASKKNIDLLVEAFSGFWWKDGKTYKYNKTSSNFNYGLIANNDLGDTVIIGRIPNEGEPGINLVINKETLTNYVYSEEDVSGVNLTFDFFALGQHPEWNYFSFELKR